jgi:hypothetical protein
MLRFAFLGMNMKSARTAINFIAFISKLIKDGKLAHEVRETHRRVRLEKSDALSRRTLGGPKTCFEETSLPFRGIRSSRLTCSMANLPQ